MDKNDRTLEQTTKPSTSKSPKKKKRKRSGGHTFLMFTSKWLFIFFCFVFSVVLGLVVGYSVLGEGAMSDVFDLNTWKHLYELAFGS